MTDDERLRAAQARQAALDACQLHHASQRFDELVEAVAVAAAASPRIVVEIGCDAGGTLYAWRQICPEVYGITLADNGPATGGQGYPLNAHGAEVLIGDSHDTASLKWLLDRLDGRPIDVLHIDGDHSYVGAAMDYTMYAPLVRPGGVILLHDVANTRHPLVDLERLWDEVRGESGYVIASKGRPVGFGVIHVEEQING